MKKTFLFLIIITTSTTITLAQGNQQSFNASHPVEFLDTVNVFVGEQFEISFPIGLLTLQILTTYWESILTNLRQEIRG